MGRVLIVEDDDSLAVILEKRMRQRGFKTVRALDAKQAQEMFRKHQDIVLVLSDYDMGGGQLNGDALWDNLKEELKAKQIPFVIISAVIPQLLTSKFAGTGVPIIEKWKLNKSFDLVVAPLLGVQPATQEVAAQPEDPFANVPVTEPDIPAWVVKE